ncbi:hypothetical protein Acr_11g0013670 [Actinidia rufa]|uniref:Uncharacterized protein n=1 Tax=Actinidia rufa TaxID=165716 RepID=A0A7J0FEE3_9ERIC|nr:hypothetical protein Acr_11g0013670 [Actinidia rufa]
MLISRSNYHHRLPTTNTTTAPPYNPPPPTTSPPLTSSLSPSVAPDASPHCLLLLKLNLLEAKFAFGNGTVVVGGGSEEEIDGVGVSGRGGEEAVGATRGGREDAGDENIVGDGGLDGGSAIVLVGGASGGS